MNWKTWQRCFTVAYLIRLMNAWTSREITVKQASPIPGKRTLNSTTQRHFHKFKYIFYIIIEKHRGIPKTNGWDCHHILWTYHIEKWDGSYRDWGKWWLHSARSGRQNVKDAGPRPYRGRVKVDVLWWWRVGAFGGDW